MFQYREEKCENYLTISLTTHASKILIAIIYRRIEQAIESALDEELFGFRFVDFKKAFDNVSWPKLFKKLKNKGIKYKDRRIIGSLYQDQKAVVEMQEERGELSIRKGVREGCSFSLLIEIPKLLIFKYRSRNQKETAQNIRMECGTLWLRSMDYRRRRKKKITGFRNVVL